MRAILDTNILVSALLTREGNGERIYRAWRQRAFVLLSCTDQIEELRAVTRRDAFRSVIQPARAGRMVNQLREHATLIDRLPPIDFPPDPFDAYLLGFARSGQVDYLVTGDRSHLLALRRFEQTRIVTARRMAGILERKS